MATDFFAQQDAARRRTGLLVFYFVLATLLIVAAVYCLAAGIVVYAQNQQSTRPGAARTASFWNPVLLLWVSGGTLAVILGGSAYKTAALNAGGESIATVLGGRRLDPDTTDSDERRLLNVVEEMALASGTPVPSVFLLDEENGINAFAAGYTPGDAVIGVTRGTLNYLTRDELQGVIAHEFSHILNGDMRLNIRLIGLLHGILLIALIGYVLVRSIAFSGRRSRRGKGDGGVLAVLAVGGALIVIGYVGVFFGRLIKSAVSRQREFLADASAVQFTRNPEGIAGALKKIGGLRRGSRVQDGHAEEASHLFFGNALGTPLFGLLATHPPLEERIRRIDPGFDGTFPRLQAQRAKEEPKRAAAAAQPLPPVVSAMRPAAASERMPIDPAAVLAMIGTVRQESLHRAAGLLKSLPHDLRTAVHRPGGAQAVLYALLLDADPPVRATQTERLREHAPAEIITEVERLAPAVAELPAHARVPLVELAFPALRTLSPKEYAGFRGNVEALVRADRRIALFEYTLRRMLLRHLDGHFAGRKPRVVRYYALKPLLPDCEALLSCLARVGHKDLGEAAAAFHGARGLLRMQGASLELLPREQCGLETVDRALTRLATASPQIKKRVLTAALACIAADGKATVAESELLRAIADALDCPMPPVASTS